VHEEEEIREKKQDARNNTQEHNGELSLKKIEAAPSRIR